MKRTLVAGGSGFVGSFLCELLLKSGREVIVVDSLITGQLKNLNSIKNDVQIIQKDICQLTSLEIDGPVDEIFNLASPASPIDFDRIPILIMDTGSIGQKSLLEIADKKGSRILFASSSEVYGDPEIHPQKEDYFGYCNSIGPRSCYDEAKRFGEAISMSYRLERKVDTRIVRIFNTYGPRMRPDDGRIIPNFMTQALASKPLTIQGTGTQTRSFCFVTDLCSGLLAVMEGAIYEPVNLGRPEEVTVLEFAEAVNKVTGNEAGIIHEPGRAEDPKRRCPDIARAKTLGWSPKVGLETGLANTMAHFKTL